MLPFQDGQAQVSRIRRGMKLQVNMGLIGISLNFEFFSQFEKDNPRYPYMSRIVA